MPQVAKLGALFALPMQQRLSNRRASGQTFDQCADRLAIVNLADKLLDGFSAGEPSRFLGRDRQL